MFNVNASLIRFWENEFDILKPKKNAKGDRFFRPEDVKGLRLIYHLLRERKYTIEGAKDFLKNNNKADEKFAMIESLKQLRSFLSELKTTL
jgi:DNA-binding transcriptional MerR regulator